MSELSESFNHAMRDFSGALVSDERAKELSHLDHPDAVGLSETFVMVAGFVMIETMSVLEGNTLSMINTVTELPDYITDLRRYLEGALYPDGSDRLPQKMAVPPPFAHYVFTELADQQRFVRQVFDGLDYAV